MFVVCFILEEGVVLSSRVCVCVCVDAQYVLGAFVEFLCFHWNSFYLIRP